MDAAQRRRMPHEWRILEQGPEGLSDIDLLASLLPRSSRRFGPEEIAARVLSMGLSALRRASAGELLSIEGVRERDAARVLSALELGRRVAHATALNVRRPVWAGAAVALPPAPIRPRISAISSSIFRFICSYPMSAASSREVSIVCTLRLLAISSPLAST